MIRKTQNGTFLVSADQLEISTVSGREAASTCPLCRESRGHPGDHSLKIDVTTGAGYCHHCHQSVFVPDFADRLRIAPRVETRGEEKSVTDGITPLDDECRSFLEGRGIDPATAVRAGVGSIVMHGARYLAFPFMENGVAVNVQFKRADDKNKEFRFVPGCRLIPWNTDCLAAGDGTSPLYITEGMMDALALMQSGYPNVVSVPNGAGSRTEVFDAYRRLIKKGFSHIVFAGDNDGPGEELRDNVKKYFDDMDVSVVKWHWSDYDCKDANDMLMCGGTEAVAFSIENARYDDCCGFDVTDSCDSDIMRVYEEGMPKGMDLGLEGMDDLVKFLPGYLYVISGYPGAGKSSLVNYVAMSLLVKYHVRTLFFTPEKLPVTNHRIELLSILTGRKFDKSVLRRDELQIAMNYMSGNILHVKEDITRDINVILHTAEQAIRRYGIKLLVIDPFLYIDIRNLNGVSEATRVSQMLCSIRLFAQQHGVAVIVVAHPRKPGNNVERPRLSEMMYEVSGSSGFFNFCDVGLMVERVNDSGSMLRIKCGKARFPYLGKLGESTLVYNPENGRYADCYPDGMAINPDYTNWTYRKVFLKNENASTYECNREF